MATLVEREGRKPTCVKGGQAEKGLHHPEIFMQFPGRKTSFRPPFRRSARKLGHAIVNIYRKGGGPWEISLISI